MSENILILRTCLALAALWAFWHYGWSRFVLDIYRQNLFSIRDELFDLTARKQNGLSFGHPAYIALRESLNNSIRFAHRISFYHVWIGTVLGAFLGKVTEMKTYKSKAALMIEDIGDNDLKATLDTFVQRQRSSLTLYMVLRSPLFIMCTVIAGIVATLTILVKRGIFGSVRVLLRAVEEQIKVMELEPSARAVQFHTDALNQDDSDLCAA